jgi:hypothetical protein
VGYKLTTRFYYPYFVDISWHLEEYKGTSVTFKPWQWIFLIISNPRLLNDQMSKWQQIMNWNGHIKKRYWKVLRQHPNIFLEDFRKATKIHEIIDLYAGTRTWNLANRRLEHYPWLRPERDTDLQLAIPCLCRVFYFISLTYSKQGKKKFTLLKIYVGFAYCAQTKNLICIRKMCRTQGLAEMVSSCHPVSEKLLNASRGSLLPCCLAISGHLGLNFTPPPPPPPSHGIVKNTNMDGHSH